MEENSAFISHNNMFTLKKIFEIVSIEFPDAQMVGAGKRIVSSFDTNTKDLKPGGMFVALEGDQHDGHDFIAGLDLENFALAKHGLSVEGIHGVVVSNPVRALQLIAKVWREKFEIPVIAVTGSNGKTTTTQMIASILKAWVGEDRAYATIGNRNNKIGVPLTILGLNDSHAAAVVEMGISMPGEMDVIASIVQPTVAVITNAQREHQEFLLTVESSARENGAVIKHICKNGTLVVPQDDEFFSLWLSEAQRSESGVGVLPIRSLRGTQGEFGGSKQFSSGTWTGSSWSVASFIEKERLTWKLAVPGFHNVGNSLAAAVCALASGCPKGIVEEGLANFRPVPRRSYLFKTAIQGRPINIIDDTYNANPDSVIAGIDMMKDFEGPSMLVLGDMGEVGEEGISFHKEVFSYASESGVSVVWASGALCATAIQNFVGGVGMSYDGSQARHFISSESLARELEAVGIPSGIKTILVKGSRFMHMELAVGALLSKAGH